MRSRPALALGLACPLVAVLVGSPALAEEFTCKDLVLTRKLPDAAAAGEHVFAQQARLHLIIDEANPSHSTLRWSGDPKMPGVTSPWPDNTRMVVKNGIIATRDGISAVGLSTLDANGALRIAESTLTRQGVIFDVIEGVCHKGPE